MPWFVSFCYTSCLLELTQLLLISFISY
uniref:Uncharacterized protein n=1 Tax=Arundo donax TaxID=35708 RepID=A0A0A9DWI0_ARUDO